MPQSPLYGIFLKIMSVCMFVTMAALVKASSGEIPPGQAVFFRSAFAIPVILLWLVSRRELGVGLRTNNPTGHLWRGLVGTCAMLMGFTTLGLLPLPEVTAIGYAAPILTVILAAMFLGETVRLFRLMAVAIGLIGVIIILSPRLTLLSIESADKMQTLGASLAFMGAVFTALAQVFVRKLVQKEQTAAIVFYFSLTASIIGLFTLPFGWTLPSAPTFLAMVLTGLLGGVGQILLTSSYRYADTAVIAPFEYTSMLLAILIGYFIFSEVPTGTTLTGACLVVASGLLIIWRESRLGLERRRQRKAMSPHG